MVEKQTTPCVGGGAGFTVMVSGMVWVSEPLVPVIEPPYVPLRVEVAGVILRSGSLVAPAESVTDGVIEDGKGTFRLRLTVPAKLLRL